MWQPVVICGLCGHRYTCSRRVSQPCTFAVICHFCEASLIVTVTSGELTVQKYAAERDAECPFNILAQPAASRHGSVLDS